MLLTVPNADKGTDAEIDADSGYYAEALKRIESGTGYHYFEVKGNFKGYDDGIVVGYGYDYEVTLPKFYYRPEQNKTDFTSVLTISRVKVLCSVELVQFTLSIKQTDLLSWRIVAEYN